VHTYFKTFAQPEPGQEVCIHPHKFIIKTKTKLLLCGKLYDCVLIG